MTNRGSGSARRFATVVATGLTALCMVSPAAAQVGGDGFLFKQPAVTLGVKAGYAMPRARSEIFDFTRNQLTIGDRDFHSSAIGADLGVRLSERFDLALAVGYANATTRSEFRDWVDLDDLPIEQVTTFRRVPVTLGLKTYLRDRGRSIGSFAWVPASWNAYAGAAGGWVFYEFEQVGDFVDFETLDVFADRFQTSGRTPTLHLFGGAEYSINPTLVLAAEGRYMFAKTDMGRDFVGFDRMDLAGFQATVGLSARF